MHGADGRQGSAGLLGPPVRPTGGLQRDAGAAHDPHDPGALPGAGAGARAVISPDVGGAFGYKCVLQQEELCIAWLALTYKRPFRFIEDRREHLTAGANSREHHYELTAYADARGRLLALDARIEIDAGLIPCGRSPSGWNRGRRSATCRGRTPSRATAAKPLAWRRTSRASCPIAAWRVPGLFCDGADDRRHRPRRDASRGRCAAKTWCRPRPCPMSTSPTSISTAATIRPAYARPWR
ncbi:protein of unknown function (plasmid) [Cupriavidus taiwanensis]|nr:protein of unknown function [Cupriavidus taiwanensis]